jgi:hypothetical protein
VFHELSVIQIGIESVKQEWLTLPTSEPYLIVSWLGAANRNGLVNTYFLNHFLAHSSPNYLSLIF